MLYNLLDHYFEADDLPWYSPLAVDVITEYDYNAYLYKGSMGWFVVVEADYLSAEDVPQEVEASFPVEVMAWYTLLEYQVQTGKKLLPRNVFKNVSNEEDQNREHYDGVAYQDRMKYVVLKVEPNFGVSVEDFGLTYYRT